MTLSSASVKYLNDRGILPAYQECFWGRTQQQASLESGKTIHCGGFAPRPELLATGSSIQIHPDTPYMGSNGKPQKWVTPVGDTSGFSAFEALSPEYVIATEGIIKAMAL